MPASKVSYFTSLFLVVSIHICLKLALSFGLISFQVKKFSISAFKYPGYLWKLRVNLIVEIYVFDNSYMEEW